MLPEVRPPLSSPLSLSTRPCSSVVRLRQSASNLPVAVPPPKSVHVITSSPKLYNLLNLIPFVFLFIGEGGAPPWPMGSNHLTRERCVLSADCLLLCARDSPLL
jgi:hypothetical protein